MIASPSIVYANRWIETLPMRISGAEPAITDPFREGSETGRSFTGSPRRESTGLDLPPLLQGIEWRG
jgi:hypothetical protein